MQVRRTRRRALLGLGALFLGACGPRADASDAVTIFAAASTAQLVAELSDNFERTTGVPVRTSVGASSSLARQIEDGAPADVFVSASRAWIEYLDPSGRLAPWTRVVATNRLVCIAPAGSPLARRSISGAEELLAALEAGQRVAIADAGVPAGEYARQALGADLQRWAERLVGREHVRAVLSMVLAGDAAAGWVYATDALTAEVEVLYEVPSTAHAPIEILALLPAGAEASASAQRLFESLGAADTRDRLSELGFRVDPSDADG